MTTVVHIDRLVLDGLALGPGQPARVRAALERELARLMRAPDARRLPGGAVPHLRAPDVSLPHDASPEIIGKRVARALHRSLGDRR